MQFFRHLTRPAAALCAALVASAAVLAQQLPYPETRKSDHVDTYHGVKVPDPYRWLEDDNSPETAAWVAAQNKVTFPYLEKIPYRAQLRARVDGLNEYEKYLDPLPQGAVCLFQEERRPAEPERPVHPERPGRAARSAARSEHVVERRDRAARCVRAVEGCEVRRLRDFPRRLRLAGIQGAGPRHEAAAVRQPRVGQGFRRGLAWRRLLLQPVPGAGQGPGEGLPQREPSGLLPSRRHAAVRRRARLLRRGEPPALPHRPDDRRRAVCRAVDFGSREGQGRELPVRSRPVERGARVLARHRDNRRRELRRRRQRRRQSAHRNESQGAELARDSGQSEAARGGELEDRAGRAARADPERQHGRRQAVRDLSQGRDDARGGPPPRRQAGTHRDVARHGDRRAGSAVNATTGSRTTCSTR